MPDRTHPWTLKPFLEWEEKQTERYELVNGQAVLMTGGTNAHSIIKVNLLSLLHRLLRGKHCRPMDSDCKVIVHARGNVRYPDATIDCGNLNLKDKAATLPAVVFEVLSDSNDLRDQHLRLADYESIDSIHNYVVISQTEPFAAVYYRNSQGNLSVQARVDGLGASIHLDIMGLDLPMAEIYERVFAFETEEQNVQADDRNG